jgi:signal transduction histidine kinase
VKNPVSIPRYISQKFTKVTIGVLIGIALLLLLTHLVVKNSIDNQIDQIGKINKTGKQRAETQNLIKNLLISFTKKDNEDITYHLSQTESIFQDWQYNHAEIINDTSIYHIKTKDIQSLMNDFNQSYHTFIDLFKEMLHQPESSIQFNDNQLNTLIQAQNQYLTHLQPIIELYEGEAQKKAVHLQEIELARLLTLIFIMMLTAIFVFWPVSKEIKKNIKFVVDAERKAKETNIQLLNLNRSLREKERALVEANRLKQEQQKLRSAYLIEGQEEERKRIAREIHDGLGQMLTALKFFVENLSKKLALSEKEQKSIEDLKSLIADTIGAARSISFNLMPAELTDFGLSSAIKHLADRMSKSSGRKILFKYDFNEERLDKNIEIGLYRITQEAINNSIKYAQAESVHIDLRLKNGYIHLNILDNGKGFEYQRAKYSSQTSGITNMQERVNLINGDLKILSSPGNGTKIYIKVPLKYTNNA